jgi:hypothetical protein
METATTGIDTIAAVFLFILLIVAGLTLFGMGILMGIGAIFSNRPLVTSWPNDQEHAFTPFERRGAMSNSRAWGISLVSSLVVTITAVILYFTISPEEKDVTKGMDMSNLTKKRPAASATPKPDAPAEAPKTDKPAEAPKTDKPAPAESKP